MDTLQTAIYDLVGKFVQRQKLPFEVIKKYRPHLVDSTQRRSTDKAYVSATQIGMWGEANEWKYYLHGVGCRVTQVDTGEVIDWDASNQRRFDSHWFADWVRWYAQQNTQEETVLSLVPLLEKPEKDFTKKVIEILEQLHRLGKLYYNPDRTNKFELIPMTE